MDTVDQHEKLSNSVLFREFTELEVADFLKLLDPLSAKAGEVVVPQDEKEIRCSFSLKDAVA